MIEFLPSLDVLLPAALFSTCRFENQRWVRARSQGLVGSSQSVGAFVDLTRILSLLFAVAFLAAYGWEFGIKQAVGLSALLVVIGIAYTAVSTLVMRGESAVVWMLGTFGIWPIGIWLSTKVSWF